MNMHWEALPFELPQLPAGVRWHIFANTSVPLFARRMLTQPGQGAGPSKTQQSFLSGGRSVAILVGK